MIYNWSALPPSGIDTFDPDFDVLYIDDPEISARGLIVDFDSSAPFVTLENGSTLVTLPVDIRTLTSTSIVFADGSMLLVGDDTSGTGEDDGGNTLTGSGADDAIYGLGGDDVLDGGEGNDFLSGGAGDDVLRDSTPDNADFNRLLGGEGNDLLFPGQGIYLLDGGAGTDTLDFSETGVSYDFLTGGVFVNVFTGLVNTRAAPASAAFDVEVVIGTAGPDVFTGGTPIRPGDPADWIPETFIGAGGFDTFIGGGFARNAAGDFQQIFQGGADDDHIEGLARPNPSGDGWAPRADYSTSTQPVTVFFGVGALGFADAPFLQLRSGEAFDGIGNANSGKGGRDTLINIMQVDGGQADDRFWAGIDGQSFDGGPGDDIIDGVYARTEARYETSTEGIVVNLSSAPVTIDGSIVHSRTAQDGHGGIDTLLGGVNDIRGSRFGDVLLGGNADEGFSGAAGNDMIDGGGGLDYARYTDVPYASGGVSVFLENGSAIVANDGYATTDTLTNIEGIVGTQRNDTLTGGAGDQHFFGRGGNDTLNGGAGSDWAHYSTDPSGVTVNLTAGTAIDGWNGGSGPWTFGFGGTDRLISIENAEGSLFADTIAGSAAANTILGLGGNDTLEGRAGEDLLNGGNGNDLLEGGQGADQLVGGAGFDYAKYRYAGSGVLVDFFGNFAQTGDAAGDTYDSVEGVIGTAFSDFVIGNNSVNDLAGLDGDDTLQAWGGDDNVQGGAGDDQLAGGLGADRLDGGAGYDRATYFNASPGLIVNLSSPWQGTGEAAGDRFASIEEIDGSLFSDTLVGDGASNFLYGSGGDDTLEGRAGADALVGWEGNDRLEGGAGADHLDGNLGFDYAKYRYAAGPVSADLAGIVANTGEAAGDTYLSVEGLIGSSFADALYGDDTANDIAGLDGNDFLVGRGGDDNLQGGNGDDMLDGGANDPGGPMNDRMEGGAGNDRFQFHHGEANGDVVVDFKGIVAGGGDILQFFGFGEAPAFNYVDSTHYVITPDPTVGGPSETITFSNAPLIVDLVDVQYFA